MNLLPCLEPLPRFMQDSLRYAPVITNQLHYQLCTALNRYALHAVFPTLRYGPMSALFQFYFTRLTISAHLIGTYCPAFNPSGFLLRAPLGFIKDFLNLRGKFWLCSHCLEALRAFAPALCRRGREL